MKMALKVLVVDDEPAVSGLLVYNLHKAGYETQVAADERTALLASQQWTPDIILLDLMIPEVDGLEVCRELRKTNKVPIIMITARGEEIDRVVGLELGADDYMCKPFSIRELLARMKAVLRRVQPDDKDQAGAAILHGQGGLSLDVERRQVLVGDRLLELTRLEFDLLHHLLLNAGRILSRERLLEQAWGYDYAGDTRVVDSAVKRLRAKLRAGAVEADCIEAVRGIGYRMSD
jgi:DNA-binding response OmpR family regulator